MPDWVTPQGLQSKTVEAIVDELSAAQKSTIDPTLNTEADSPLGNINGIFASQLREGWELLEVGYHGFDPDAAEGFLLEKVSAISGTRREPAAKSTVICECDIDGGTTLVAGSSFASVTGQPDNRWTPVEDFTAPGDGVHDVLFESEEAGPLVANSGTLEVIATPVIGWNSVTNPLDADVGHDPDSDPELRLRRERELRATGTGTPDAIRADLLAFEAEDGSNPILQATVFENVNDVPDAFGLPPHSIEVVLAHDGSLSNSEIAQLIWAAKPGGIKTVGTSSGTAVDSQGTSHTVRFSLPTDRNVWLTFDVTIDENSGYAGAQALKDAVLAKGLQKLLVGRDVIAMDYRAVAQGMAGVIDVTSLKLGFAAAPAGTANLTIGVRERAVLDGSRIVVNETFGPIP